MQRKEAGFSMVELLIVVAIMVIISAIAVPNLQRINASYKLDSAEHSAASLLQQARLQAVRNNQPAYVQYDTSKSPNMVFVNADLAAYAASDPDVELAIPLAFQTAGLPDHGQLDAYLGVSTAPGSPKVQIGTPIGYNARGLPCVEGAAGPVVCQQQDASGATPVFEWFISNGRGGWGAITVTAAGRVKTWRMVSQNAASGACGYAACWQ
jgi:prepilin-type N-terminal cleavage/methylation domain-containing protein